MCSIRDATAAAGWRLLPVLLLGFFAVQEASAVVGFTMTQGTQDGTYIRFKRVPTNMLAEVTKELGAFRCSQPGLYYFSFTAMAPSPGSCRISLRRNRVPVVTAFASNSGFSWISSGALLYLAQNDLVYLYLEDGTIHESSATNRAFTSFTGFAVGTDMLMGRTPDTDAIEGPLPSPDPFDDIAERMYRVKLSKNATAGTSASL
ncbi:complement C1q tumor necrosis factor-related protein 4 [Dermacentor silvarum]|uniref:complement C1q tumor necrosis factor-related protein 4 n=1 Tax=Dermacentor silvarum TaxID=543639 RepID=UPI001897E2F2|nr:complement C1q tumor necrosis factor-related protein 4 [Dermacentor silvarum]